MKYVKTKNYFVLKYIIYSILNKKLFNIRKYQTDRNNKTVYKKRYNIYSMDQKEIIKNLNQKSSHNNYEISKSLNKVSNDKNYKKNKGKRRTIARNIIYNLLTQNNNNKITNIIIPKYKNTHNILKETKNPEKLSKYILNDNENIINNNENDFTYKNTDRSNISYQKNIKN